MARPIKDGVDYFPLDVHLDDSFDLIEAEFGLTGFAVVVKLLQKIYGGQGYYCEWTNDVALLFGKKLGFEPGDNAVSEIVRASIRRGIFDSKLYEKYHILTSSGIQKRYLEAVNRRKKVDIENQYLLIDVSELPENVYINGINVNINSKNDSNNTQTKEKEIKVNESKVNQTKENKSIPATAIPLIYLRKIGTVTQDIRQSIYDWCDKVGSDVVIHAIEEAEKNDKKSWDCVEAIICNHYED